MYKCAVCRGNDVLEETLDRAYRINGEHVIVYGIPATVCVNCGEVSFSIEDIEKVGEMLHYNERKPAKWITIPAFEFVRLEPTTENLLATTKN
jgi:YgiT-type zinc finger domain-containing protein